MKLDVNINVINALLIDDLWHMGVLKCPHPIFVSMENDLVGHSGQTNSFLQNGASFEFSILPNQIGYLLIIFSIKLLKSKLFLHVFDKYVFSVILSFL